MGSGEAGRSGKLVRGRFAGVGLGVLAAGGADLSEPAHRVVGQRDRPLQLGEQVLHRLSDPEGRVGPERGAQPGVIPPRGEQQADDPLLSQLVLLDSAVCGEPPGEHANRRQKRIDQLPAGLLVSTFSGHDQLALPRRRYGRVIEANVPGVRTAR